ncbi:MAG: glycosyltransferase family 1 protein, partial [Pseudomonadota bacterium]
MNTAAPAVGRAPALFALPGPLDRLSGGTRYDLRVIAGLQALGHVVETAVLPDTFPTPSQADLAIAGDILRQPRPASAPVIVDGLAYGAMPPALLGSLAGPIVALVHHPLALETGVSSSDAARLRASEIEALRLADVVVVTSGLTCATLSADYGVAPASIIVAEPGVDRCAQPGQP